MEPLPGWAAKQMVRRSLAGPAVFDCLRFPTDRFLTRRLVGRRFYGRPRHRGIVNLRCLASRLCGADAQFRASAVLYFLTSNVRSRCYLFGFSCGDFGGVKLSGRFCSILMPLLRGFWLTGGFVLT